jgi:hypothetical protein
MAMTSGVTTVCQAGQRRHACCLLDEASEPDGRLKATGESADQDV